MLAYDDLGTGPPLLLLHGTPSSRREWRPVLEPLAEHRRVIAPDLPGFGESPPIAGAAVPRAWVASIGKLLDQLGLERVSVAGSSMGGWTALELARAGRARAALALAPAGLWSRHPLLTDVRILSGQIIGRLAPRSAMRRALQNPARRRRALRNISVDAGRVPAEWAIRAGEDALASPGWWPHYRVARSTRFTGGAGIDPRVPVRIVFGEQDRIARAGASRRTDELPSHARIEVWPDCGHMIIWDARERALEALLELP